MLLRGVVESEGSWKFGRTTNVVQMDIASDCLGENVCIYYTHICKYMGYIKYIYKTEIRQINYLNVAFSEIRAVM